MSRWYFAFRNFYHKAENADSQFQISFHGEGNYRCVICADRNMETACETRADDLFFLWALLHKHKWSEAGSRSRCMWWGIRRLPAACFSSCSKIVWKRYRMHAVSSSWLWWTQPVEKFVTLPRAWNLLSCKDVQMRCDFMQAIQNPDWSRVGGPIIYLSQCNKKKLNWIHRQFDWVLSQIPKTSTHLAFDMTPWIIIDIEDDQMRERRLLRGPLADGIAFYSTWCKQPSNKSISSSWGIRQYNIQILVVCISVLPLQKIYSFINQHDVCSRKKHPCWTISMASIRSLAMKWAQLYAIVKYLYSSLQLYLCNGLQLQ